MLEIGQFLSSIQFTFDLLSVKHSDEFKRTNVEKHWLRAAEITTTKTEKWMEKDDTQIIYKQTTSQLWNHDNCLAFVHTLLFFFYQQNPSQRATHDNCVCFRFYVN